MIELSPNFQRFASIVPRTLKTIDKPQSLVIHPKMGFLFLLTINEDLNESIVMKITTDVHNETLININTRESGIVTGLAIDDQENRLYFYTNSGIVGHVDFNGDDIKILENKSPVLDVDSMIVDEEWLYLKNTTSIWRMGKTEGDGVLCIVPETKVTLFFEPLNVRTIIIF